MRATIQRNGKEVGLEKAVGQKAVKATVPTLPISPIWATGLALHTSLKINASGDKYEQEADHVAEQVTRMPASQVQRKICSCGKPAGPDGMCEECKRKKLGIQRMASTDTPQVTAPPIVQQVLQQPGRPLDDPTRNFMESRFGHDFSGVRVRTDSFAAQSAAAIQARAYTVGQDMTFGSGEYAPNSTEGRQLIAHELTHIVQQRGAIPHIQRAPLDDLDLDTSTSALHGQLAGEFATATGTKQQPGLQYTEGYQAWLQGEADKYKFQPPTVTRQNPLDRLVGGVIKSHTFHTINGTKFRPGGTLGNLASQYQKAIAPPSVTSKLEATGVSCRFGNDFHIQSSAEIIVHTKPGANGWRKTMDPNQVLRPPDRPRCAGQTAVPVTLRGQPTDTDFARAIEDGEMEHVQALEMLHNKHLVPYYHFVRGLQATGTNENDCEMNLRQKIGGRDEQAAVGFILGDLGETRRFDDPALGTHHATTIPNIGAGCNAITLTSSLTRPQLPRLGPGNAHTIAPVSLRVDSTNLTVSGNDLNEGSTTLRSFSSPANANLAMQVFQHYNITELLRLGSFEFLLSNGGPPSGAVTGPSERNINSDYYQVTFGAPGPADWSIVEAISGAVNLIHNFGGNRDRAYSAVELMRQHGFNRQVWLGAAASPELQYFRKD